MATWFDGLFCDGRKPHSGAGEDQPQDQAPWQLPFQNEVGNATKGVIDGTMGVLGGTMNVVGGVY